MVKNQNLQQSEEIEHKVNPCNRIVYRCQYCLEINGEIKEKCSRKIKQHIIGSHKSLLTKYNQLKNFKLTVGRDAINTQKRCQEPEKIFPKTKSAKRLEDDRNIQPINQMNCNNNQTLQNEVESDLLLLNDNYYQMTIQQIMEIDENEEKKNDSDKYLVQKLQETIIIQKQIIMQLINSTKILNKQKGARDILKNKIIKIKDGKQQFQELKKLSKKEVESVEFTTQNIQQKINQIKASYPDQFIIQDFLVNEFQQKSLIFLVSTFKKYFNEINEQNNNQNQNNQQPKQQNYFVDVRALESEKKKQDKLRNMVHKQFVKSIKQQQQQKFQTNNMDIKTPPIRINVDVFEKNALKIIGDVQRNLRNESFSALEVDYHWPLNFQNKNGENFLNYETQSIQNLYNLEIEHLQDSGYLFMWTIASKFIEAVAFMIYKGYRQVSYTFNLIFLELLILLYGQKKANIKIMLTEWVTIQDITRRYVCLDQKDPHHLSPNISQQLIQLNLYQAKIQKNQRNQMIL
ncbi:hypothetical protein OXYTRIMIC_325 [Oxytricha trifallax]|uniref:Uncharacterized protein n=1 Tax=Oxytricha trifallax TaxID=1172189 RepID=A0A073HYU8_9SPIT|nr:hypothetical protein OXYTRIMIC_325 [Oxytricha trifallax]